MPSMRSSTADRAQVESLGSLLLVAVVVVSAGTFGAYYLGSVGDDRADGSSGGAAGTDIQFEVSVTTGEVTLSHNGGPSVATAELTVRVENRTGEYTFDFDAGTFRSDNDRFDPGETWRLEWDQPPNTAVTVALVDADGRVIVRETVSTGPLATEQSATRADGEEISVFTASNSDGQDIKVSFESTEPISAVTVEITGVETVKLTRSDFTRDGDTYSAIYDGSSDGSYNATLIKAEDADGNDGASGQFDIVSVETGDTAILDKAGAVVYQGLSVVAGDGGEISDIGVTGAEALGPPNADLTGDGSVDLPYVKDGDLRLVDSAGNSRTLVTNGASSDPDTDKTLLAVGAWNGSPASVFYVDGDESTIHRVDADGSTEEVATPSNGASAVSGIGDIDGDNTEEFIFVDSSQQIRYIEPSGTVEKLANGGVGSNNGMGIGQPHDFDDDGTVRIVNVDGSNNVRLSSGAESDITFESTSARKGPVTVGDVDGDGVSEIVYVSKDNRYLKYVDDPLGSATIETLTDGNGDRVTGSGDLGIVS